MNLVVFVHTIQAEELYFGWHWSFGSDSKHSNGRVEYFVVVIVVYQKTIDHILRVVSFYCWQFQYICFDLVVERVTWIAGCSEFVSADWDCLLSKQRWAA